MNVSESVPSDRVRAVLWWALLVISPLVAATAGFLARPETRIDLWLRLGTPLVELSLVSALLLALPDLLPALRSALRAESRRNDLAALGILLLASLVMLRLVHPEMRMQADESALVGTSFGLHLSGLPLVPSAGYYDTRGELHMLASNYDKRGLLFPILLNGMHALFGFSADQGLRLNALLTLLMPALAYAGLRRHMGVPGALAGALLSLVHPVLIWCGASSGFEPLNAVLILIGWLAVQAAAHSGSVRRWLLVGVIGALAAQARYESVLFGAALFTICSVVCARRPESNWRWGMTLVPLLYLPFAWQRALAFDFGLGEKGAEPFAAGYFVHNVGHALSLFALPSAIEPFGFLLALLVLVPALVHVRGKGAGGHGVTCVEHAVLAAVLVPMLAIFSYAWGNLTDPFTMRYGLPLMILMSILAGLGLHWTARRWHWPDWLAPVLAALTVVASVPATRNDSAGRRQLVSVGENTAIEWARTRAPHCRPLFVEQYPNYFLAFGYAGLPPDALASTWANVRAWAREGDIDSVWFVEVWNLDAGSVLHKVPDGFSTDELYAVRLPWQIGVRILALDRADAPLGRDCRPETANLPAERQAVNGREGPST